MPSITGYVGSASTVLADGVTSAPARQDKTGALVFTSGRADGAEQSVRGLTYAAFIPPGTGQAPGTAIGTTAAFTLALSSGLNYRLVVRRIMLGYISGTLGAGTIALLAHFSASGAITAPTGGTAIVPTNLLLGSNGTSQANCRFNNTVPATGLMIRSVALMGAGLASTATFPSSIADNAQGEVVVGAGQAISIQAIAAAGTSPLITVGMIWVEEPTA